MRPEDGVWRKPIRREMRGRVRGARPPKAAEGRVKMPVAKLVHELKRDESAPMLQRVYRLVPPRPDCTYVLASTVSLWWEDTNTFEGETLILAYDGGTANFGKPLLQYPHMHAVDGRLDHEQWKALESMGYTRGGKNDLLKEVALFIRST